MSAKRLRLSAALADLIVSLHPELKRKVKSALRLILKEPHAGKALRDELAGLRSFRIGGVRIVYRVHGEIIEVIALGPRRTIYEETFRLIQKSQRPK